MFMQELRDAIGVTISRFRYTQMTKLWAEPVFFAGCHPLCLIRDGCLAMQMTVAEQLREMRRIHL
jgi:hypothetical protein